MREEERVQPSDVKKRFEDLATSGFRGNVTVTFDGRGIAHIREERTFKYRKEFQRMGKNKSEPRIS